MLMVTKFEVESKENLVMLRAFTLILMEKKPGLADKALVMYLPRIYFKIFNIKLSEKQVKNFLRWEKISAAGIIQGFNGRGSWMLVVRKKNVSDVLYDIKNKYRKDVERSIDEPDPVLQMLGAE